MNKTHTSDRGRDDEKLSHLDEDDAPELTPELAATLQPLAAVDPDFAAFVRKGGRPQLPERYRKRRVTMMLDPDVIEHFKAAGKGWQTRVNAALRKAAGL